ncbi:MAG: glycosyltransferase family 2 protein [Candidatus Gastranaerophilales bacterium]|nr:glycosyltransferase family 2 protein [Candidatus Gastranaerophilales bacterium]
MKYNSIISTQVKDENDYLDEWISYHLDIGFDHIVIYDNESAVPVKKRKHTTVIPEHRIFEASAEDNCHNDTVKNFDANWIARIDVDEFIVLKEHANINDFLEPYKEFGGVGINWRIFGTSGHIEKPEGLVRDNYFWRMPDNCGWILNGGSFHLKTIIRREFCKQIHHPHFCISERPLVNEDFMPYPDAWTDSSRTKSVIHHYVTKSLAEWNKKYDLWRHRFGLRTLNDLEAINNNCIVFDDSLKTKNMNNEKNWQWASHQPMIKGVLDLYNPQFVMELGIGDNSTMLFAGRKYIGIENDPEWIKHMEKKSRMTFLWHDLDRQSGSLQDYYGSLNIPEQKPNLLFVDNYESCRMIAINTLRDKFDMIIFHDCEPGLGARVNHYDMINSEGFNVYFLKTSANWTGLMVKISSGIDRGFNTLLSKVNPHIENFKKQYPEVSVMYFDSKYEGFAG